jgi:hypothetical protein
MEFFFTDPNVERLDPARTRLLDLKAEPYSDGKRLRVSLELTPFKQRPNIELTLTDGSGQPAAAASIVEPTGWKLEVTLHIRGAEAAGAYRLSAGLDYADLGEVDRREITIEIPTPAEPDD